MALVTRRYRYNTADPAALASKVAPSAVVQAQYVNSVDLQVNDAVGGTTETLDEYMATLGYVYDPAAPANLSTLVGLENTWWFRNAGASLNDRMYTGPGGSAFFSLIMPRAGHFLAATAYSQTTMTAPSLATFIPAKAATATGATVAIPGMTFTMDGNTFPRSRIVNYTPGLYTFAAGEKFEILMTTGASSGANNYSVTMEVVYQ